MTEARNRSRLRRRELDWDNCDRCGKRRLIEDLVAQDGYLVCVQRCADDSTSIPQGTRRPEPTAGTGIDCPTSIDH